MSSDSRLIQSLEDTAHFISSKYKLDDVLNSLTKKKANSLKLSDSLKLVNLPLIALDKLRQYGEEEDDGAPSVHSAHSSTHSSTRSSNTNLSFKSIPINHSSQSFKSQLEINPTSHSSCHQHSMSINRPGSSASSNSCLSRSSITHPKSNSTLSSPISILNITNNDQLFELQQTSNNSNFEQVLTSNNEMDKLKILQEIHDPKSSLNNSRSNSSLGNNSFHQQYSQSIVDNNVDNNDVDNVDNNCRILQEIEEQIQEFQKEELRNDLVLFIEPINSSSLQQQQETLQSSFGEEENVENYEIDETYEIEMTSSTPHRIHLTSSESIINQVFDNNKQTRESIEQVISQLSQYEDELDKQEDEIIIREQFLKPITQTLNQQHQQPTLYYNQSNGNIMTTTNNTINTINTTNYNTQNNNTHNNNNTTHNNSIIDGNIKNDSIEHLCIPPLNEQVDLKSRLLHYTKYLTHSHEKIKLESIKYLNELIKCNDHSQVYYTIIDVLNNNLQLFYYQSMKLNRQVVLLLISLHQYLLNNNKTISIIIDNVIELLKDSKYFEIYDCLLTLIFRLGIDAIERVLFECVYHVEYYNNNNNTTISYNNNTSYNNTSNNTHTTHTTHTTTYNNNSIEWNNIILTHVINHPLFIKQVIIPVLHKECLSFDHDKRVCAVRSIKHLGLICGNQCLSTLLKMLQNGSIDRVLTCQAIRSMGEQGEKCLIKLMESNCDSKVKHAIATVFGELPYMLQSNLTIIANSDIHHFIKSPNPRVLYYHCGDENLPSLLLFDSRELISISRNVLRKGLLNDIEFGNQYTCKSELTLLHAMVSCLKQSTSSSTTINNNNTINNTMNNTTLNNTHNNNSILTFNQSSYAMDQNSSFSILKQYYDKECEKRMNQTLSVNTPRFNSKPINTSSNNTFNNTFNNTSSSNTFNNNINTSSNNSSSKHFQMNDQNSINQIQINRVSIECVNSLICNFKYMDECVRIASVKSIINLINLSLPNFNQVIESLKLDCLTDPSPRVRSLALDAFAKIGKSCNNILKKREKRIILQCILPLIRDSHWHVRMSACNALCEHYQQVIEMSQFDREFYRQVFHILSTALREGTLSRNEICKCFSLLEYDGISQLIYLLRQDSQSMSIQVRISSCYGLSLISTDSPYLDRIVETLFMTCNSIEKVPPLVRRAAIKCLGDLASKSNKLSYLGPRSLLPFLYSFMKDRQSSVRQMAAQVLAHSGPHGELLLMEALLKDSNYIIRSSAAFGMTFIGPKSIISLILALSNELNTMVKKSIYNAIQSFKFDDILSIIENNSQKESILNTIQSILNRMDWNSDWNSDLFNNIIVHSNGSVIH